MGPVEILKQGTKEMGMEISQNQIEQFIRYKDILLEWNRKMNLTAITEEKEIIIMHFLDSISCIQTEYFSAGPPSGSAASTTEPIQPTAGSVRLKGRPVPSTEGPTQPTAGSVRGKAEVTLPYSGKNKIKIIDVGTGAGFPGVPLKIMLPDVKFTLLDSLKKRIGFLQEVCSELNLSGVELIHSRAEDLGKNKDHREKYDCVVSRAVAALNVLVEYCLPFASTGGYFICQKGPKLIEEMEEAKKAIKILGGKIVEQIKIDIPFSDRDHHILIIKKIEQTPIKYPRKAGKPSKNPIK